MFENVIFMRIVSHFRSRKLSSTKKHLECIGSIDKSLEGMFPVTYSKIPPPWTFRSTRIRVSDVQSFRSLTEYRHFSRSSATICCYLLFRKFLRLYFFHKTKKYLHYWKPDVIYCFASLLDILLMHTGTFIEF